MNGKRDVQREMCNGDEGAARGVRERRVMEKKVNRTWTDLDTCCR